MKCNLINLSERLDLLAEEMMILTLNLTKMEAAANKKVQLIVHQGEGDRDEGKSSGIETGITKIVSEWTHFELLIENFGCSYVMIQ